MRHRRQKKSLADPYRDENGELRPLSPIETTILSAFAAEGDDRLQDALSLAGWLNGQRAFPRPLHRACERLAAIVLADLVRMGLVVRCPRGWHRLADRPPQEAATQETQPAAAGSPPSDDEARP